MTAWTKLAYGSIAATVMLGAGGVVYFIQSDRPATSIVTLEQWVAFDEAVAERTAAALLGPFTTNGQTEAGWNDYWSGTNVSDAENWSFNFHKQGEAYTDSRIPLYGSSIPRIAAVQTFRQVKALAPFFVSGIATNVYGAPVATMLSVTQLWAELEIGDGTSSWTVAVGPSNEPLYGSDIGSAISTTLLAEGWAVLSRYTTTVVSAYSISNNLYARDEAAYDTRGTNHWDLETQNQVIPYYAPTSAPPTEAEAPFPANWTQSSGTPLDYSTIQELLTFNLADLGPLAADSGGGAVYIAAGEECEFNLSLHPRVVRDPVDSWPAEPFEMDITDVVDAWGTGTNKITLLKSAVSQTFPVGAFPSGVVARVRAISAVDGYWQINHPRDAEYAQHFGPSTNYVFYGFETQEQQIVFSGLLAAGVYTNVTFFHSPAITNWVPSSLLTFTVEKMAYTTNTWTYQGRYHSSNTREAYPVASLSADGNIVAPEVQGRARRFDGIILISWTYKYRGAP